LECLGDTAENGRGQDGKTMMTPGPAEPSSLDRNVFLIGRPPLEEFLGFVAALSPEGEMMDQGGLASQWRTANDHIRELESSEVGLADNPPIEELSDDLRELADKVTADPVFQRSFQLLPASISVIELDKLVVFQKHIDLNFVEELKAALGSRPTAKEVFSFCLPTDPVLLPVRRLRVAQNAWTFISHSTDFRFLEPVLLEPKQVIGYRASGRVVGVVGLLLGYGSNYLNALKVGNRLIFNNGSHRAYALHELGIMKAPCLIQYVSRPEELGVTANREVVDEPERYVEAPRPPMLKDYFNPRLRQIIEVPRRMRQVRVTFGVEQTDLPA